MVKLNIKTTSVKNVIVNIVSEQTVPDFLFIKEFEDKDSTT